MNITRGIILLAYLLFSLGSDAQKWESLGIGTDSPPRSFYSDTIDSVLYVGGNFSTAGGITTNGIAVWDGTSWDSIGSGMTFCCIPVFAMTNYKGELHVGGLSDGIAKWDGVKWNTLGQGLDGGIFTFLVYNDELYVGGVFDSVGNIAANSLAKWDGTAWSDVHDFPNYNTPNLSFVYAIEYYKGELYVGGNFGGSNGNYQDIVRFDGSSWQPLGTGLAGSWTEVGDLQVYKDELYVSGFFTTNDGNPGNYIAKWNGSEWSDVGGGVSGVNGQVRDLAVINDELYAVGAFVNAGGVPAQYIAKWNGVEWCGFGSVFDNVVGSIATYKNDIYIGGGFLTIDSDSISMVSKWLGGNYTDTCGFFVSDNDLQISETNLGVYPNPTTGLITLTNLHSGTNAITIYNTLGKLIYYEDWNGPDNLLIDITEFPTGLYSLHVGNEVSTFTTTIINL